MRYEVEIKPRAIKDGKRISKDILIRILERIEGLADDLRGDVKRLTNFSPEYRLRVGEYRILFEIEAGKIVVYRIRHRKDVYK